jgi:phage terminase large subunit
MKTGIATEYQNNIVGFVQDVLKATPRVYQEEGLLKFMNDHYLCVRAPHSAGKTTLAAWCVLWGLACFPEIKVPTTATAWRQLTDVLWPEIKKWALRANWSHVGITLSENDHISRTRLEFGPNRFAVGLASKEETRIEGYHSAVLMYVFDEAKGIPVNIWNGAQGALVGGNTYCLAISTPGLSAGRFFDIQSRKAGTERWTVMHIKKEQCEREVDGFKEWAEDCKKLWGEQSPIYKRRVLAEFAEDEEGALIPLWMIEEANERWHKMKDEKLLKERSLDIVGVDVGHKGESQTVLARLYDEVFIPHLEKHPHFDTMETTAAVRKALLASYDKATGTYSATANVDAIGVGAGVVDRAKELGLPVKGVNVSVKTKRRDVTRMVTFVNLRSYLSWRLRERLDPNLTPEDELLALPPDDELTGDLVSLRYETTSAGKIKVESKDEIKKRIGRSPDCGDSVCLLLWTPAGAIRVNVHDYNPLYG